VRKNYQRKERKSNHKFDVVRGARAAGAGAAADGRGVGRERVLASTHYKRAPLWSRF
jgi:hypothetical protein